MANEWVLWQLADSAFPSGGFAHSGGLEAAIQLGIVSDSQSLEVFLQNGLLQIGRGVAHFAQASWTTPDQISIINRDCDLFLNNHVSNRASRAQGQALLAGASKAFADQTNDDSIARWAGLVRRERLAAHLAPVFGLVSRSIGIPLIQTKSLLLFIHLRGYISASVRLGIVGPMQGQQIQAELAMNSANCSAQPVTDAGSTQTGATQINPILDLIQMTQDRLYSRLFQS